MENDRIQVIERLKQSNNVLITVNNNPTVDQLAACIGITLLLNKLGKHATAVFSGAVPSTIEFLKPLETIEKNTDSLRDFIIALDKAKADKLRYKVEDTMVKIFITPYKTSISDKDLEFSQGDFNVDVVLALGIHEKEQVDQAIMAHGRILHDAVVMSVNNQTGNTIGSINWVEEQASSLSEMLTSIADDLQQQVLDEQIATALLTGIVAETERFRNDKTTSVTMSMSSKLMAAGANQQLVATELEPEPEPEPEPEVELQVQAPEPEVPVDEPPAQEPEDDGAIIIDHPEDKPPEPPAPEPELPPIDPNEIDIDREGTLRKAMDVAEEEATKVDEPPAPEPAAPTSSSKIVIEPPSMGGTLTANSRPEQLDPSVDPLSVGSQDKPMLSHDAKNDDSEKAQPEDTQTLEQIEAAVNAAEPSQPEEKAYPSSYFNPAQSEDNVAPASPVSSVEDLGDAARDAVQDAIGQAEADGAGRPQANAAISSTPVALDMGRSDSGPAVPVSAPESSFSTVAPQFTPDLVPAAAEPITEDANSGTETPDSPPPVPPPMMPPTMPPFDNSSTSSPQ